MFKYWNIDFISANGNEVFPLNSLQWPFFQVQHRPNPAMINIAIVITATDSTGYFQTDLLQTLKLIQFLQIECEVFLLHVTIFHYNKLKWLTMFGPLDSNDVSDSGLWLFCREQ